MLAEVPAQAAMTNMRLCEQLSWPCVQLAVYTSTLPQNVSGYRTDPNTCQKWRKHLPEVVYKAGAGLECYDIMLSHGVGSLHPCHPVQDACIATHTPSPCICDTSTCFAVPDHLSGIGTPAQTDVHANQLMHMPTDFARHESGNGGIGLLWCISFVW